MLNNNNLFAAPNNLYESLYQERETEDPPLQPPLQPTRRNSNSSNSQNSPQKSHTTAVTSRHSPSSNSQLTSAYKTAYLQKPLGSREKYVLHKQWEGQRLPCHEPDRPVSNLYFQKLVIAIDWEYTFLSYNSPPANNHQFNVNTLYSNYQLGQQYLQYQNNSHNAQKRARNNSNNASYNSQTPQIQVFRRLQYHNHQHTGYPAKHPSDFLLEVGQVAGHFQLLEDPTSHLLCALPRSCALSYAYLPVESPASALAPLADYSDDPSYTDYLQSLPTSTSISNSAPISNSISNSNTPLEEHTEVNLTFGHAGHRRPSDGQSLNEKLLRSYYGELLDEGGGSGYPRNGSGSGYIHQNKNSQNNSGSFYYRRDHRPGLTIEEVLSKFLASEEIDYFCEKCRALKRGKIQSSLRTLPDILILHLKRLVMSSRGGAKIRTLVKFPIHALNLHQFTTKYLMRKSNSEARESRGEGVGEVEAEVQREEEAEAETEEECSIFDLFGVVNHMGGIFGGHYTAYAQCEDLNALSHREVVLQQLQQQLQRQQQHPTASTSTSTPTSAVGQVFNARDCELFSNALHTTISEYLTTIHATDSHEGQAQSRTQATAPQEQELLDLLELLRAGQGRTKWYRFDDEFIMEIGDRDQAAGQAAGQLDENGEPYVSPKLQATLVSESAYLLFYKKRYLSKENLIKYT